MNKQVLSTTVVAILLAGAVAYLMSRSPSPRGGQPEGSSSRSGTTLGGAELSPTADGTVTISGNPGPARIESDIAIDEAVKTEDDRWKERLLELLNNDSYSDRELGRQLLKMVDDEKAPDWLKAHAMSNALNFTDDENYGDDIKPLAFRTDLPEPVNDVVFEDLINRDPNAILPIAREFAKVDSHPLAGAIGAYVESQEQKTAPE